VSKNDAQVAIARTVTVIPLAQSATKTDIGSGSLALFSGCGILSDAALLMAFVVGCLVAAFAAVWAIEQASNRSCFARTPSSMRVPCGLSRRRDKALRSSLSGSGSARYRTGRMGTTTRRLGFESLRPTGLRFVQTVQTGHMGNRSYPRHG